MKKILKIVLVVLSVFILIGVGGIYYLNRGLDSGKEIVINNIDLSLLEDGVYYGEYRAGRFSNKVRVEIANNKFKDISLLDDVTFAKPEVTEELFNRIIKNQENNVDVISGSTITCKAYLKGIENALITANQ